MVGFLKWCKRSKTETIWFRTDLTLVEIASALGLSNASHEHENYWEWLIGGFMGQRIDITRTHKQPAREIDTGLFLLDEEMIDDNLKSVLVKRLRPIVSGSIKCGRWIYLKDNDFDKLVPPTS